MSWSSLSASSSVFSPAYVNSRLSVLAATAGDYADPAHKMVAVDDLRHCVLEGQRTREQSGLLCTQMLYGEEGMQVASLPATFRRWVQSETYGGVRGSVLELLTAPLPSSPYQGRVDCRPLSGADVVGPVCHQGSGGQ